MPATPRKSKKSSATAGESADAGKVTDSKNVNQKVSENEDVNEDDEDEEAPVQVNNASLSELKNALDDSTKSYFNTKAGFSQNHGNEDFKLALGWAASLIAGGISLAGWYYGWEKTQGYTGYCVAAYALISVVLTLFSIIVDKDTIYIGKRTSKKAGSPNEKITISSDVRNFEPIYRVSLAYETSKKGGSPKRFQVELEPHFKNFFDVDGYLDESGWNKFLEKSLNNAISKI